MPFLGRRRVACLCCLCLCCSPSTLRKEKNTSPWLLAHLLPCLHQRFPYRRAPISDLDAIPQGETEAFPQENPGVREHGGWRKGKAAGSWFFLLHPEGQKNLEMGCDFVKKKSVFPIASPDGAGKDVAAQPLSPPRGRTLKHLGCKRQWGGCWGSRWGFFYIILNFRSTFQETSEEKIYEARRSSISRRQEGGVGELR